MALYKVILPAMGEGIFEATITQWLVNTGSEVNEDDSLVEIATDKVDSEIPAPVSGVVRELLVQAGEVAEIGTEILVIETNEDEFVVNNEPDEKQKLINTEQIKERETSVVNDLQKPNIPYRLSNGAFLSPLVRRIAEKEAISVTQLNSMKGTGLNGRITKDDVLNFISGGGNKSTNEFEIKQSVEVIEMDRMRKIIAKNMVQSKQIAPHVTSFHEADVTNLVQWRENNKADFLAKYGQKLTLTPLFIEAVAQALKEYPRINASVVDDEIHVKHQVNIGMATALPNGDLIVPVINNAANLKLNQLAVSVNDLANRARNKALKPHEIQGGTFTVTNVGAFGNLSGTPIINQPEVAILALGAIKKRPAVIETPHGDLIGIRHQIILSLSYDHRVVDGSLGGMFLKKTADILEAFNTKREI